MEYELEDKKEEHKRDQYLEWYECLGPALKMDESENYNNREFIWKILGCELS